MLSCNFGSFGYGRSIPNVQPVTQPCPTPSVTRSLCPPLVCPCTWVIAWRPLLWSVVEVPTPVSAPCPGHQGF